MNCQKYKNIIEELTGGQTLSADALQHLENCLDCHSFKTERERLRALVSCLETVNAPANFEFGVKARLQNANSSPARSWNRRVIFAGAAALGAVVLAVVIGSNYVNQPNANNASPIVASGVSIPPIIEPTPENSAINSNQNQSNQIAQTESSPINQANSSLPVLKVNIDDKTPTVAQASVVKKTRLVRAERVSDRNKTTVVEDDPVKGSITSGLGDSGTKNPNGINPEAPLNAQDALRTYGVETEADKDGLRVKTVKSANSGLKAGDVIQKINNKDLDKLESGKPVNMILTVKGESGTREIELKNAANTMPPQ